MMAEMFKLSKVGGRIDVEMERVEVKRYGCFYGKAL